MTDENAIKVSQGDLNEDRFDRFRLIKWWNQDRIGAARVLVVGAGALGNEIVKNLALLGFRQILIVDLDQIECSNLSRSVLFRPDDIGKSKAGTAARSARTIFPEINVHHLDANILYEVGLGVFRWADVILAGLDNREARLWINRCAWKTNRPWIDGAIEGINGVARVFLPGKPPCYECTLGETDWAILEKRMSCNLLSREEMVNGKVPTTPTISSIIAGVQVQEAVKILHDLPVLAGKALVFEGLNHTSYVVEYTANPACMSHEIYENFVTWSRKSAETAVHDLFEFAQDRLGEKEIVLEFSREVIHKLVCPTCKSEEEIFLPVGKVGAARGNCPHDSVMREVVPVHSYTGKETFGTRKLSELGLPLFDVFVGRSKSREVQIILECDAADVLGPLTANTADLRCSQNSENREPPVKSEAATPAKSFCVQMDSEVLRKIRQHARSSMRAEVCGILIGNAKDGLVTVEACIAGERAAQGGAHVTFTQETWAHIYKEKDREYPEKSVVGWYHSHPGFGVFLSDHDLFIHENFFSAQHQIAWVFDPHSDEEGCFGWRDGKTRPLREITVLTQAKPELETKRQEPSPSVPTAPRVEPAKRKELPRLRGRKWRGVAALACAGLVATIAFLLCSYPPNWLPSLSNWKRWTLCGFAAVASLVLVCWLVKFRRRPKPEEAKAKRSEPSISPGRLEGKRTTADIEKSKPDSRV